MGSLTKIRSPVSQISKKEEKNPPVPPSYSIQKPVVFVTEQKKGTEDLRQENKLPIDIKKSEESKKPIPDIHQKKWLPNFFKKKAGDAKKPEESSKVQKKEVKK